MHDFRKASSEEELKREDKFKYDNNFFNWGDPKVLKYFTKNTRSMKKAWKKTFGFPYATAQPWDDNTVLSWDGINATIVENPELRNQKNMTKCFKKCAQYVSSFYRTGWQKLAAFWGRTNPTKAF